MLPRIAEDLIVVRQGSHSWRVCLETLPGINRREMFKFLHIRILEFRVLYTE